MYERGPECVFVHVDVTQWTKKVRKKFLQDISVAHSLLGEPVYAQGHGDLGKQAKFLRLSGFIPCGTVIDDESGAPVPMYVRPVVGLPHLIWQLPAAQ